MIGTLVFYRDNEIGWVLGRVSEVIDEQWVMCSDGRLGGGRTRVLATDVAVARTETLEEVPYDLSQLSALHPGTLILALKKRCQAGSPFSAIGPKVLVCLYNSGDRRTASTVSSDSRKAERINAPLPQCFPVSTKHLTSDPHAHLAEPLGWWSHAKKAFSSAMQGGSATVVCLGEMEASTWLHRMQARRKRREDEAASINMQRLGGEHSQHHAPPPSDLFDDDLLYDTGTPGISAASQRLELSLCRLGGGTWLGSTDGSSTTKHLRLASLLSDAHLVCEAFLSGQRGRRGHLADLGRASSAHPAHPQYCRNVVMSYDEKGFLQGFRVDVFWTARGAATLNIFRILANSRRRTHYLGPHSHPDWHSTTPYVARGEAFQELNTVLMNSFKMQDTALDAMWSVIGGAMLLHLVRFEDVNGRGEAFFDSSEQLAEILGTTSADLKAYLKGKGLPGTPTRVALCSRRDALCDALCLAAFEVVLKSINFASMARSLAADHVVNVITVPGVTKPSNDTPGTLGDLCHNVSNDAMWGMYDTTVFDTAIQMAEVENCPLDPLLDQLRGRSVLEKINPVLRVLADIDAAQAPKDPLGTVRHHDFVHANGDKLTYDISVSSLPQLEILYRSGFRPTPAGSLIKAGMQQQSTPILNSPEFESCLQGRLNTMTHAGDALETMQHLLSLAKNGAGPTLSTSTPKENALYWMLTVDCSTDASVHPAALFDGLKVEAGLYACRVVETALFCKVGHPIRLSLDAFCSTYKSIICPAQVSVLGQHKAVQMVAEVVFGPASSGWDRVVHDLPAAPKAPMPLHLGQHYVHLTPTALLRLDAIRAFTLNKLALLCQMFAKGTKARSQRRWQTKVQTIQSFAKTRLSRGCKVLLHQKAAMGAISFEMQCLVARRRKWRALNGVEGSRLRFMQLKALLAAQRVQRMTFVEDTLQAHCDTGFAEYEAACDGMDQAVLDLQGRLAVSEMRCFLQDEAALRSYLADEEDACFKDMKAYVAPFILHNIESTARGVQRDAEFSARMEILLEMSLDGRDLIELRCAAGILLMLQDGEFKAGFQQEEANRKIIDHSESRCRDLITRDFALAMIRVMGSQTQARQQQQQQHQHTMNTSQKDNPFVLQAVLPTGMVQPGGRLPSSAPSRSSSFTSFTPAGPMNENYSDEWKVEFEGIRRTYIVQSEANERQALCVELTQYEEAMMRTMVEIGEIKLREYFSRFPQAAVLCEVGERSGILRTEANERQNLQRHELLSHETTTRRSVQDIRTRHLSSLSGYHTLMVAEARHRASISSAFDESLCTLTASSPAVYLTPLEEAGRAVLEAKQSFCYTHMARHLLLCIGEGESWMRLMETEKKSLMRIAAFKQHHVHLRQERQQVREQLTRRQPIVRHVFEPEEFLFHPAPRSVQREVSQRKPFGSYVVPSSNAMTQPKPYPDEKEGRTSSDRRNLNKQRFCGMCGGRLDNETHCVDPNCGLEEEEDVPQDYDSSEYAQASLFAKAGVVGMHTPGGRMVRAPSEAASSSSSSIPSSAASASPTARVQYALEKPDSLSASEALRDAHGVLKGLLQRGSSVGVATPKECPPSCDPHRIPDLYGGVVPCAKPTLTSPKTPTPVDLKQAAGSLSATLLNLKSLVGDKARPPHAVQQAQAPKEGVLPPRQRSPSLRSQRSRIGSSTPSEQVASPFQTFSHEDIYDWEE